MIKNCFSGHKNKPVELIYLVPSECEGIKKVTYTIQAEDCLKVWNRYSLLCGSEILGLDYKTLL